LWDIALQLGFFLSPIVYDASLIPSRFQLVYSLNPVTRLIESARDIFLLHKLPTQFDSVVILSSIAIVLAVGFLVFRRLEGRFAEEL
jgi:ABC-type polysaccharide/polyol phosphate export permease